MNDLKNSIIQKFIQTFELSYIVGYGNPWRTTHLIIKGINKRYTSNLFFIW
jgi:hypothetical protein